MKHAYNEVNLHNLAVIKESKRWSSQGLIEEDQLKNIEQEYPCSFYHPNIIIRILLFIAALFALSGVTGFFALLFGNSGEKVLPLACLIYGVISFALLDRILINQHRHYKSGVAECILYHACGFAIVGLSWMADFNTYVILITCLLVFSYAAFRYLDLLTTMAAIGSFAGLLFYTCYEAGGIFQQVIPFVFIVCFGSVYAITRKFKVRDHLRFWSLNMMIVETISLLLVYAAGNYLVFRELSINLMNLELVDGQDIPFAFLFYALTIIVPFALLYVGIKHKDVLALRVSLIAIAFTVFTFKYYYGFGHPEITLTVAGALLFGIALLLFNYLKTMRGGFTRENHLAEKWANLNLQAFVISQTLGGNQSQSNNQIETGGGGKFGGGGSTDSF
jgi:uncharacterized membrane protein YgcG